MKRAAMSVKTAMTASANTWQKAAKKEASVFFRR